MGSGGKVNAAVVLRQFTFLSGEICSTCVSLRRARPSVTAAMMGQKSAEAIAGKDVTTQGSVVAGNKPGIVTDSREDLPCRRAELEEGDVILLELPMQIEPDRVSAWSAS